MWWQRREWHSGEGVGNDLLLSYLTRKVRGSWSERGTAVWLVARHQRRWRRRKRRAVSYGCGSVSPP
jgi:hypothetical protein